MAPRPTERAGPLGRCTSAGRFRHAQSLGRRHGAHPDGARLRGARDHQRRPGVRARPPRRRRRGEPRRGLRMPASSWARRRCRSRRTWRTASAMPRRPRPRRSVWRPMQVWPGARSRTTATRPADLRPFARDGAHRGGGRSCPSAPFPVHAHRARRESCTAAPISTTPSAGCRRSKPRARTCSTRRGCAS